MQFLVISIFGSHQRSPDICKAVNPSSYLTAHAVSDYKSYHFLIIDAIANLSLLLNRHNKTLKTQKAVAHAARALQLFGFYCA